MGRAYEPIMDWRTHTMVKVRFADVDMMGHVNNAQYFTFLQHARLEYFKRFAELNFLTLTLPPGKSVILAQIQCTFKLPALLDETLRVKIRTKQIRRTSFVLEYEIEESVTNRLVATAESVQVLYDYASKTALPIEGEMRKVFEEIEGRSLSVIATHS